VVSSQCFQIGLQAMSEDGGSKKAVESAKSAVTLAQKAIDYPQRSNHSSQDAQRRPLTTQPKLDVAQKEYESIKRWGNLITKFRKQTTKYWTDKQDAERHSILPRRILEKVPLIEVELTQRNIAGIDSDRLNSMRRKLKRCRANEFDKRQDLNEQIRDNRENDRATKRGTSTISASQLERKTPQP
jgi:hypothetical protein